MHSPEGERLLLSLALTRLPTECIGPPEFSLVSKWITVQTTWGCRETVGGHTTRLLTKWETSLNHTSLLPRALLSPLARSLSPSTTGIQSGSFPVVAVTCTMGFCSIPSFYPVSVIHTTGSWKPQLPHYTVKCSQRRLEHYPVGSTTLLGSPQVHLRKSIEQLRIFFNF